MTRRHAFFLEPSGEFNDCGWRRLCRVKRNYFAGRIEELGQYAFEPKFAINDYPHETLLNTCTVLSRKRGAGQRVSVP